MTPTLPPPDEDEPTRDCGRVYLQFTDGTQIDVAVYDHGLGTDGTRSYLAHTSLQHVHALADGTAQLITEVLPARSTLRLAFRP